MPVYAHPYRILDTVLTLDNLNNFRDHPKLIKRLMVSFKTGTPTVAYLMLAPNNVQALTGSRIDANMILAIATVANQAAMFDLTNPVLLKQNDGVALAFDAILTFPFITTEFQYVNQDGIPPDKIYQG